HELAIPRLAHDVGHLVAVLSCVQVGSADATAQHVDQNLSPFRHRCDALDDLELVRLAADRPHVTPESAEPTSVRSSSTQSEPGRSGSTARWAPVPRPMAMMIEPRVSGSMGKVPAKRAANRAAHRLRMPAYLAAVAAR